MIAETTRSAPVPLIAGGLTSLLALATLGQGGAAPNWMMGWHALLVFLVLGALLRQTPADGIGRSAGFVAAALTLFTAVFLAGAVVAPYGYAAWLSVLELGAFLAVFSLAARLGRSFLDRLAPALLVVASAQALWVGVAFATGHSRPAGSFQNANHLAAWLVACALLGLGPAFLRTDGPLRRHAGRIAAGALIAGALLATGSRGGVVGLGAGLVCLVALAWPRMSVARRRVVASGGALALVGLAAAVVASRAGEADPFRYQRLRIWKASFQVAVDAPWTGTGPRQFVQAARNVQFADGDGSLRYDRGFSNTHSDLLRVPCELGWPGIAALAIVILSVLHVLRSHRRRASLDAGERAAVAALVALCSQALVDNLSQRPALYLLQAALLGVLVSRPPTATADGSPAPGSAPPAPGRFLRILAAVVVLIGFGVGDLSPYLAWRAFERGDTDRALQLNPAQPDPWRRRATEIAGDGADWQLVDYAAAREAAERAIRLSPRDSDAYWTLAQIEALACRTLFLDVASRARARDAFKQAAERSRYNALIPLTEARFLLATGDAGGARRAAERALTLEPDSVVPRLVLARALLAGAGPESLDRAERLFAEARAAAEKARVDDPSKLYARALLVPEPALVESLGRELGQASSAATLGSGAGGSSR